MLALLIAAALQCPNGAPPPCAAARAPDPDRIAILPFRVTTADTLLGEGLAELLATEIGGESGPRAVHMGTVLRAWRRSGGALRSPLSQEQASRLARDVDAGRYVEGSVVGLGARLTLAASVVRTAGGTSRRIGPVSGPTDSLEVLVGRLASALLAATGADATVDTRSSLTSSPAAMQSYLAGLQLYRRGNLEAAIAAFDRAISLDSSFARAAWMRYRAASWVQSVDSLEPWVRLAWSGRDRLPPLDRVLLVSEFGERYPGRSDPAALLAGRERGAAQVPESPDAHYLLGDYLYHQLRANGLDSLARARAEFERTLALDSQATVLEHLLEIGVITTDSALLRRVWPALERMEPDAAASWGFAMAVRLGDTAMATRLLPEAVRRPGRVPFIVGEQLPAAALTRWYDAMHVPPDGPAWAFGWPLIIHGHPRAPAALRVAGPYALLAASFSQGDSAAAMIALDTITASSDSAEEALNRCAAAHWRMRLGQDQPADTAFLRRNGQSLCAALIEARRAVRSRSADAALRVAAADSMARLYVANVSQEFVGYENLPLAGLWESIGLPARALAAIRLRLLGAGVSFTAATGAREEGRLALMLGDTTAAVLAYRRYLELRGDPDPALMPERDSVRALLGRLDRR